ncbi:MAG: iduronate sulfatase, partial [Akkermansiaceae bacterium]
TLEGESLQERLVTPASKVEDIAFSRYQRGDSIRFGTWRYSEYRDRQGKVIGRMLYDHAKDPLENENVVAQPQNKTKVRLLSERLKDEREKAKR